MQDSVYISKKSETYRFLSLDNTGALLAECVNVLKHKVNHGYGGVGDEIVCVVKKAQPISTMVLQPSSVVKVRRGDVRRAVIVRTKKPAAQPDGRVVELLVERIVRADWIFL